MAALSVGSGVVMVGLYSWQMNKLIVNVIKPEGTCDVSRPGLKIDVCKFLHTYRIEKQMYR